VKLEMSCRIVDVHGHVPVDRSIIPALIESTRVNGVDKLLISSLGRDSWPEFPTDDQVADANEDTFALCESYPDLLRGYVYLNPQSPAWAEELDKWTSNRFFVGVKLWVALRNEDNGIGNCVPLLERAAECSFPILVHSFFRCGGNMSGEVSPAEIAMLGRAVPGAKLIMAHLGGTWEKGLKAIADEPNVHVDVSGGPASRGAVECAVRHCGAERVLFGSDVPCRTIQSQIHKVRAADIAEQEKESILTGNARSIFKLS